MPALGIGAIYFSKYNYLNVILPAPAREYDLVLGNNKDLFIHSQHNLLAHPKMTLLLSNVYRY